MSFDDLEHIKSMDFEFLHVGDLVVVGPAYHQLLGFAGEKHSRAIGALLDLSAELAVFELGNFEDRDAWVTTGIYRDFGFKIMFIRSRFYVVRIFEASGNHDAPVIEHGIVVSTRGHKPRVSCFESHNGLMSYLTSTNAKAIDDGCDAVSYRHPAGIVTNVVNGLVTFGGDGQSAAPDDDTGAVIWCNRSLEGDVEADPRCADAPTDSVTGATGMRYSNLNEDNPTTVGDGWAVGSFWLTGSIVFDMADDLLTCDGNSQPDAPGNDTGAVIWRDRSLANDGKSEARQADTLMIRCPRATGVLHGDLTAPAITVRDSWAVGSFWLMGSIVFDMADDLLTCDDNGQSDTPGNDTGAVIWCDRSLASDGRIAWRGDLL